MPANATHIIKAQSNVRPAIDTKLIYDDIIVPVMTNDIIDYANAMRNAGVTFASYAAFEDEVVPDYFDLDFDDDEEEFNEDYIADEGSDLNVIKIANDKLQIAQRVVSYITTLIWLKRAGVETRSGGFVPTSCLNEANEYKENMLDGAGCGGKKVEAAKRHAGLRQLEEIKKELAAVKYMRELHDDMVGLVESINDGSIEKIAERYM